MMIKILLQAIITGMNLKNGIFMEDGQENTL